MSSISPKVIDVDGNRVPFVDGDEKTMDYSNRKSLHGWGIVFDNDNPKFMKPFVNYLENGGRFPTQLFTNIKNDKYKYVKYITMDK